MSQQFNQNIQNSQFYMDQNQNFPMGNNQMGVQDFSQILENNFNS
jgi:hypothetical protein